MTYEHPLAAMARDSCDPCMEAATWPRDNCAIDGAPTDEWCHNARFVRAWTASHVPLSGLPVEVVRAMAELRAAARASRHNVSVFWLTGSRASGGMATTPGAAFVGPVVSARRSVAP